MLGKVRLAREEEPCNAKCVTLLHCWEHSRVNVLSAEEPEMLTVFSLFENRCPMSLVWLYCAGHCKVLIFMLNWRNRTTLEHYAFFKILKNIKE